jgi:anti-sigma B factor antagonist
MPLEFGIDELDGFPVILLEGSLLERHEADDLLEEVKELIEEGSTRIILELSKLNYLNSSGLNVLLNILTKVRNANGEAVICGVNERLRTLLVITKLDAVFQIAKTCEEASQRLTLSAQPPRKQ